MHIGLGVQRLTIVHWSRKCPDSHTQDQAEIPAILSGRVELKGTALGKHVSNPNTEETQGQRMWLPKGVQEGPRMPVPRSCFPGDSNKCPQFRSLPPPFLRQGLIVAQDVL